MQKNLTKVLSLVLALVMVLGLLPISALASGAQVASSDLPTAIDGLSIAYPYNTETVQLTGTVPNRFSALTFESARNEVESAQMILTPNFQVDSFELTMDHLFNEKGNIIPASAFEVYTQHYVTVSGSGNSPKFGDFETLDSWFLNKSYIEDVFHPRGGNKAWDGVYPDALIPQEEAIAAGENTIASGNNQGIWVNLNVGDAAPGTYTGSAKLTINGTAMQIPVSIRIYDVAIPEEVHMTTSMGIWWDQLEAGEGYVTKDLADSYYEYLVSKRIAPWSSYGDWYETQPLVESIVEKAADPAISSYLLYYYADGKVINKESVVTTLTALINKNLELANAGNNIDLFEKAYFYFTCVDEPAGGSKAPTYADVQVCIDILDDVKTELAPMLDAYPELKASFLGIKNMVTGPNPDDDTFYMDGCADYSDHDPLTSIYNSVMYTPQFHHMHTQEQRDMYANDEEVWWYGCCHPVAPYPTFHYNTPLMNNRAIGWMMYDYDIDGMLYSCVNYWGTYTDNSIALLDYWNGYNSGTPGDQILVYPGSDYGITGPIGSIRLETIRESSEDYEYMWMLENQYGISDLSAYTNGLYDGAIVTGVYDGQAVDPDGDGNTDAAALHHTRRVAMLSKLETLSVAANGATEIEPGQENFVRGQEFKAKAGLNITFDNAAYAAVSFEYKLTGEGTMSVILRDPDNWTTKTYGDYTFNSTGLVYAYGNYQSGITCEILADGYVRVTMVLSELQRTGLADSRDAAPESIGVLDVYSWTTADGYIDNVQVSMEAPAPEEPEVTEPEVTEPEDTNRGEHFAANVGTNIAFDNAAYTTLSFDYKLTGEGTMSVILRDTDNWTSKTYGDYTFNATGLVYAYGNYQSGITCEILEDGYVHVTMKLSELQRTGQADNRNAAPENIGVLDIYSWTNVDGYIDNVQLSMEASSRGEHFAANVGANIAFDNAAYTTLSFDYKLTGEGTMTVILRDKDNWTSKTYGDYTFNATGLVYAYGNYQSGITCELLEDGYVHVTMVLSELQRTGQIDNRNAAPENIGVLDIYSWTNVDGYIDNVQAHIYTAVVTEADCENEGYTTYTCSLCGDSYVSDKVAALGHNYEAVVTDPTPEAQGYTTHTCSRCGHSYVDSYTDYVPEENYIVLSADMNVNLSLPDDLYINLNGFDMTGKIVTNGYKVYGIDATTDSYTCENIGYFNCVDAEGNAVVPENNHKSEQTGAIKRYLTIKTEEGYSFHRIYVGITHMSLQPGVTGVGYKAIFGGDDMVKAQLAETDAYGYNLWLEGGKPITRSKTRDSFVSGDDLTLRIKNFQVEGYGETKVYATVYLKLADGTVIESAEYAHSLREMVEAVNDYYTDYSKTQLDAVCEMIERNPVMLDWRVENLFIQETPRGQEFKANVGTNIAFDNAAYSTISFDYKLTGEGTMSVILRDTDNWTSKVYGDYTFNATGLVYAYGNYQSGITCEIMEDGYVHVTMKLSELQRTGQVDNRDAAPENVGVLDIYSWTNVDGYIDNVQVSMEAPVPSRGEHFAANVGTNIAFDNAAYSTISFDYKLTGEGTMSVILRDTDNWTSKVYGDYTFNATGLVYAYGNYQSGITCELLEDGYVHVTMVLSELQRTGLADNRNAAPKNVGVLDIYSWTNVDGYIDNVQCVAAEEHETLLLLQKCNGTNASCSARDYSNVYFSTTPFTSANDTLTLVVKTDCTSIKLRGMSNLGNEWSGTGVTKNFEDLGDGWKKVTFTLSEIVGSNDVTTMNGFRIDGLVEGMDILMKDILINGQTDWIGEYASNYHGAVTLQ